MCPKGPALYREGFLGHFGNDITYLREKEHTCSMALKDMMS